MPRRNNSSPSNSQIRQNTRRNVMRTSGRLRYATEMYRQFLQENPPPSFLERKLARHGYVVAAHSAFARAGKLNSLPVRNDKIVEKLFRAYDEVLAEIYEKRAKQHTKTHFSANVRLNNRKTPPVMAIGLRTNNKWPVVVLNPGNKNKSPNKKKNGN